MSEELVPEIDMNLEMMEKISRNHQTLDDIRGLTSSKVTDQLKVFLISQARNELSRVVKLTKFLDRLETEFIGKVEDKVSKNEMTLKQYSEVISLVTSLLSRSGNIISQVLGDDRLMTILNTTIYTSDNSTSVSSIISPLKDAQSREKVRNLIQNVLVSITPLESGQRNEVIVYDSDD